jgi:TetR/AcrR family transcriptional repressor of nem operon
MDECLSDPELSPLSKLRLHFRRLFDLLEQNDYTRGCPIGNLCQEMGDLSEPFREKLKGVLDGMRSRIVRCLEDAKIQNEIPSCLDSHETSEFIISSWQGALMQMKVRRIESPFRTFDKMVFEVILRGMGQVER